MSNEVKSACIKYHEYKILYSGSQCKNNDASYRVGRVVKVLKIMNRYFLQYKGVLQCLGQYDIFWFCPIFRHHDERITPVSAIPFHYGNRDRYFIFTLCSGVHHWRSENIWLVNSGGFFLIRTNLLCQPWQFLVITQQTMIHSFQKYSLLVGIGNFTSSRDGLVFVLLAEGYICMRC